MWMFWIVIVPLLLLMFWRLNLWRRARANVGEVTMDSSENQGLPANQTGSPQNQPHVVTHGIEEVVDTDEESHSMDSSLSVGSTELIRKKRWYTWGQKNCAFMAGIGGLLVGYLTTLPGGILAVPLFLHMVSREIYLKKVHSSQDDFCVFRNQWLFLHSSTIHFMALLGISMSFFCIAWGRRHVLKTAAVLMLIGIACMSWFPYVYVEVIGMLVSGCGVGLINQVIPFIYSEIMPEDVRSVDIFTWGTNLGSILASISIFIASRYHVWGWRFAFGAAGVPVVILLALSFLMTESPHYFIEQERMEAGKRALKGIRASEIEVEYAQIVAEVKNRQSKNAFKEMISPSNRPTLVISTMEILFAKLSGVDLIIFFGPFLFESTGYTKDKAFLAPVVLSIVQTIAKGVGALLIPRIGRRKIFLAAYLSMLVSLICLGIVFHFQDPLYHLKTHRATISMVLVLIYTIGGGVLAGPYGWQDTEFSQGCANLGSVYVLILSFLTTFMGNQIFLHILCTLRDHLFFVYVAFCFIMMCFTLLFIPETTGIEQHAMLRRVWARHWFWRRYVR